MLHWEDGQVGLRTRRMSRVATNPMEVDYSLRYPLHMVDRLLLEVPLDLAVVFAHVLRIPPVAASQVFAMHAQWERGRGALQRDVACTHDRLSDVIKAMVHMPRLLYGIYLEERLIERDSHGVVGGEYCMQTV